MQFISKIVKEYRKKKTWLLSVIIKNAYLAWFNCHAKLQSTIIALGQENLTILKYLTQALVDYLSWVIVVHGVSSFLVSEFFFFSETSLL